MVVSLLGDSDLKVVESAITTFGSARIPAAGGPLVEMLRRPDPLGWQKHLRMKALQTLGEIGDPKALPEISHFFRSVFALVNAEERLSAFESLEHYPASDRERWVKKGLWSPDRRVREICARLQAQGGERQDGE
jgi:HEAT repeat protein